MPRRRRRRELKPTGPPTREEIDSITQRLDYVEQKANMGRGISAVLSGEPDVDDSYLYDWDGNAATATEAVNAITVGGFPVDDIPYITDGAAPASSPTPTVRGALGALVVEYDPISNADIVTYEIHLSVSTGFTPDSTTLAAEKRGGGPVFLRTLPDGTALTYATDYYIQIVAKDADGSAGASAEASGQMDQTGTADLVALSVTADKLAATLVLASLFQTASSGQRVEFDVDGIRLYDTDGTTLLANLPTDGSDPFFAAEIDARGIDIDATNAAWRTIQWLDSTGFACFSLTASDPSGVGDDSTSTVDAHGHDAAGDASLQMSAFNDGDDQASITLSAGGGIHYSGVVLLAKDSGNTETRTLLDSLGTSQFVQIEGTTDIWRLEHMSVAHNLASRNGHGGGSETVALTGVAVGDLVLRMTPDDPTVIRQFLLTPEFEVSVADEVQIESFNSDTVTIDPSSQTFHFLIAHRS